MIKIEIEGIDDFTAFVEIIRAKKIITENDLKELLKESRETKESTERLRNAVRENQ